MTFNTGRSNVPIFVLLVSPSPKFHSASLYVKPFWMTGHFDTSTLNDLQMTLNTTRSKVPHICVTIVAVSQISLRFTVRPAVLELKANLRQVHRMTAKWHSTLQCQRYPVYVLPVFLSPTFKSVSLFDQPFSSYRHFDKSASNDLTTILNTTRSKVHHICVVTNVPGYQIQSISLYTTMGAESSLPVAHPGYQVLSDVLFRLGLIANYLIQCSS